MYKNKLWLNQESFWGKHPGGGGAQITEDYANIMLGEYAETNDPSVIDEIGLLNITWLIENNYFAKNLPDEPIDKMLLGFGEKTATITAPVRKKYNSSPHIQQIWEDYHNFHQEIVEVHSKNDTNIDENGIHDLSHQMYITFQHIVQQIPLTYHTSTTKFAPIVSLILSNLALEQL